VVRTEIPRLTLLGHPEGTVLRGCDPGVLEDLVVQVAEAIALLERGGHPEPPDTDICGILQLFEGGQTVRDLTFEHSWWGLMLGWHNAHDGDHRPTFQGGHRIEGNTFRHSANGVRATSSSPIVSVIRDNTFVNLRYAMSVLGSGVHLLDNDFTVPEPERPLALRGDVAVRFAAERWPDLTSCEDNVIAGNRITGYAGGIAIYSDPGTSCRNNVIRRNTIALRQVDTASSHPGLPISLSAYVAEDTDTETPDGLVAGTLVESNRVIRADGPGISVSRGGVRNRILENTFDDVAGPAVVLEGDSNHVELRNASDQVRDLGRGNQLEKLSARQRHPGASDTAPTHSVYDAETFFDTEIVFLARWDRGVFSHDERRVLLGSDRTGTFNVFAIPVEGGVPEQLTNAEDGSLYPVSWFPHDDRFLYEGDEGGDERSVLRVRELDGSSTELTPAKDVRAEFLGWSTDGSAFWVATDERARPVMDLYRYSSKDYDRAMIFRNDGEFLIAGISETGRWIALQKTNSNTDTDLHLHDLDTGESIPMSPDVEGVRHRFMDFSPDGDIAYYGTDQFGEFQEVWRYRISTGARIPVERAEWDVRRVRISPAGSYRIAQITEDAFPAVRVTHVETGDRLPFPELPVGEVGGGIVFSPSETKLLLAAMGPRTPGDLYLIDLDDPRAPPRQLTRMLNSAIDPADLVEAETVRFVSSDGVEIPGILYRPRQSSHDHQVPALVYLHGGPGGISTRTWDERLQHLVNQGCAVFDVNYRGSQGYGKTFLTLDDRRHGEADVQDLLAARDWLAGLDWWTESGSASWATRSAGS
jgi:parallel beta-helix repeat protein